AIHLAVTVAAAVMASTAVVGPDAEAVVALAFGVSAVVLGIRRRRALEAARRYPELSEHLDARAIVGLEERIAELELGQQRLLELEERLDFAERLLARQAEVARLPGREEQ
ncbi:MAG: hypothetical protein MUC69_04540, partial [Gemmatimonadales bacterium]|nr:hypothetical protein [Gemmatimonadales bacterium]